MDEPTPDPKCEVCGRRLLPGERPIPYLTRDRQEVIVCELCKGRAEAAGWQRPQDVAVARAQGKTAPGRSRRRQRGAVLADLRARGEQLRRRYAPGEGPDGAEGSDSAPAASSAAAREATRARPAAAPDQG